MIVPVGNADRSEPPLVLAAMALRAALAEDVAAEAAAAGGAGAGEADKGKAPLKAQSLK